MLKSYNAITGQSIYDVCLNTYGTLDLLVKLLVDSGGGNGVDDIPASRQAYIYDDALVVDQSINQAYTLSGIIYATADGINGQTYYIIKQKQPILIKPAAPSIEPPPNPDNVMISVESTQYVSNANGTTVITPLDKSGNSMIGYEVSQLENEIRPLRSNEWSWNKVTGILTLINGAVIDSGNTLFILYTRIL